uniref:G_PROTEIN_RECEP_F1_2 domain-containing protein n=1 Tax=Panagrellus redivivus TaxID=6233 RepID=A0A7E4W0D1_PANRE
MELDSHPAINAFRYIVGFAAIIGNITMFFVIVKTKKFRKFSSNQLMALLAVADCLTGIGALIRASFSVYSVGQGWHNYTKIFCQGANLFQGVGITANQAVVLGMAFDRLMAVCAPQKYNHNRFKVIPYLTFVGAVIYSAIITFVSVYGAVPTDIINLCSNGASAGPYFAFTWAIFSVVQSLTLFGVYFLSLLFVRTQLQSKGAETNTIQMRIFIWVSMILLSQVIFWQIPLAFLITGMILKFSPTTMSFTTLAIGLGSVMNAAASSVITFYRNAEFRQEAAMTVLKRPPVTVSATERLNAQAKQPPILAAN